jgi:hypothetical protein
MKIRAFTTALLFTALPASMGWAQRCIATIHLKDGTVIAAADAGEGSRKQQ